MNSVFVVVAGTPRFLQILCNDNVWQNLGRGFFVSRIFIVWLFYEHTVLH